MGFLSNLFILDVFLFALCIASGTLAADHTTTYTCNCTDLPFDRSEFPPGFLFGAASASYQTEGAWNVSGKGPSIWDTYTHAFPDRILDGSNGDVATNSYYMFQDDVRAAKLMSLDTYRISLSWPRLLPNGRVSGGVNPDGVRFYNELIDEILSQGLHPCVTIFHWEVPQHLEDLYGGFLSPRIVEDFVNFADLAFKLFGDRVTTWITLNEPLSFSESGYALGLLAPGRCSFWYDSNCTGGDAGTEPYIVTHHQLLAHAAAYRLYKAKYAEVQNGRVGITLVTHWFLPYDAKNTSQAPNVALEFEFGWFMRPITYGDYPPIMKERVQGRLPRFTSQEKKLLKGSYDFLGLNYYTGQFAHFFPLGYVPPYPSYETDGVNRTMTDINGTYLGGGPEYDHIWVQLYPLGLFSILEHIREEYGNPTVFITENGMCTNASLHPYRTLNDTERVTYMAEHVCCLQNAMTKGSKVEGMIFWSLVDNFEWYAGYTENFGLYYIDRENGYQRIPKYSALWLASHLAPDYVRGTPDPLFPSANESESEPESKPKPEVNPITLPSGASYRVGKLLGDWI